MSKELFKLELKRLFRRKEMVIILVFSFILVILQAKTMNDYTGGKNSIDNCDSAFLRIIGFDFSGEGTSLYAQIFSFLAAIVGASLYAEDRRSNFLLLTNARVNTKKYTVTSAGTSFVAGGIAVSIPYLLQSWIYFMKYPTTAMDQFNNWFPFHPGYWGYKFFLWHPFSLWFIYLLIFFILGGICSLLGFITTYFIRTKYLETIIPFFIQTATWLFFGLINYPEYSLTLLLSPINSTSLAEEGSKVGLALIITIVSLLILESLIVWRKTYDEVL